MRKQIKKMLWGVTASASLALIGFLVIQASMVGVGKYVQASTGSDFGEVEGYEWAQNSAGDWVADIKVNPSKAKGDLSKFMVLGDSNTFGYMVGYTPSPVDRSLVTAAWPKLIADHVGVNMELAYFSEMPDNLAVPGYTLGDMLTPYSELLAKGNPLTRVVLGGYFEDYGDLSPVDNVLRENPTTVAVMIGANNIFGTVIHSNVHRKTPVTNFHDLFSEMVDKLAANPERAVVVSTVPDPSILPFLVPVSVVTPYPQAIPVVNYADGSSYTLSSTDYISLVGIAKIQAKALPLVKCPGLNEHPDINCSGQVVTQPELDAISTHVAAFNVTIRTIADQYNNVGVMNFDTAFTRIKEKGVVIKGTRYTLEYRGGAISLDGFHSTKLAQGLLANEFIKTMNMTFAGGIKPIVLHDLAANETLAGAALNPPVALNDEAIANTKEVMKYHD